MVTADTRAEFELDARLAGDTRIVGDLTLCRVLLMNDARYPWLILVPRRPAIREIYQLPTDQQSLLWQEVSHCGEHLMRLVGGHKLNVAALGNQVPQLHVHLIARFERDPAWPGPVWGVGTAEPHENAEPHILSLRDALGISSS